MMRTRKRLRLRGYDYSRAGAYFVTICTKYFIPWLGTIKNGKMELSSYGEIVRDQWKWLENQYQYIRLDEFIIMPDHFHGIIWIKGKAESGLINAACQKGNAARREGNPMRAEGNPMRAEGNPMRREENSVQDGRDRPVQNFSSAPSMNFQLAPGADHPSAPGMDFAPPPGSAMHINLESDNSLPATDDIPSSSKFGIPRDRDCLTRLEAHSIENSEGIFHGNFPGKIKPIPELVGAFKTTSSKRIHLAGLSVFYWHRSYHERVIRNVEELNAIRNYIIRNPSRWRH
jgi:REP element-mobilizing transposase RayT